MFWITVLAGAGLTAASWFLLPDRVPLHFGSDGVDEWGSRTESVVFFACLLGGLALLFWVLAVVVPRIPESLLNIPERDKTWWLASPERRRRLNEMLASDLYAIGAATMIFFVAIQGMIIRQASAAEPELDLWFWVLLGAYLLVVLGWAGYMVAVRYRAPQD